MKAKRKPHLKRVAPKVELTSGDKFESTGRALVKLGNAIQNRNTTVNELVELACNAGVKLQFRIISG